MGPRAYPVTVATPQVASGPHLNEVALSTTVALPSVPTRISSAADCGAASAPTVTSSAVCPFPPLGLAPPLGLMPLVHCPKFQNSV